jgi:acyl-CoA reductase-like NAD-dependent aldehyde dehydrogenase
VAITFAYVEEPAYDEFVELVAERARRLRQGADSRGFEADLGSLSSEAQLAIVERHVSEALAKGARALVGGKRADVPGAFYEPTVLLDVDQSMSCMREETFGPTLPVMKVRDAEEAIRLANDSRYGLSASVWTRDRDRGERIARPPGGGCGERQRHVRERVHVPCASGRLEAVRRGRAARWRHLRR